jgi:hypothetical protein
MLSVFHTEFSARFFDQSRDRGVIDVADTREEVVLNLEVQAAQQPTFHSAAAREVDSGFDLMYGPGVFHRTRILPRQRELGLFNAMG